MCVSHHAYMRKRILGGRIATYARNDTRRAIRACVCAANKREHTRKRNDNAAHAYTFGGVSAPSLNACAIALRASAFDAS